MDAENPNHAELITSSFRDIKGHLLRWNIPAGNDPAEKEPVKRYEPTNEYGYYLPRALGLFAAAAAGRLDHAAVILQAERNPKGASSDFEYSLGLLRVKDGQAIGVPLRLWSGPHIRPVMSIDSSSRHLAIAGNKDNDIFIFSIPELLTKEGQALPRQKLRSLGTTLQHVAFVLKGDERGLLLNERKRANFGRPPLANDMVFDFKGRKLIPYQEDWKLDAPRLEGWLVTGTTEKKNDGELHYLLVRHNDEQLGRIALKPRQIPKTAALLPPGRPSPFRVPILAVAYGEAGETLLELYNAKTGEAVRRLTGHVNEISSLSFSADGRLLVSAAHDQTVCVWSLTDLDRVLEQQGGVVNGLGIRQDGAKLVAVRIDTNKLGDKAIREGDVLESVTVDGKLHRPTQARDYYDVLWRCKPGSRVTLRFRGQPPATLILDQGSDERKPLFSLFITDKGEPLERKWVGWNPVGPYDSNAAEAERFIGWHRNTGDEKRPTEFVPATEYRGDDFKQGLLEHLVAKADTSQGLDAWNQAHPPPPPKEPELGLWIDEIGPEPKLDGRGRLPVRQRKLTLKLIVLDELPEEKIAGADWQVEGLDKGAFVQVGDKEWSADLSKLPWKRGEYRVTGKLRIESMPACEHLAKSFTVLYQPPAPVITYKGAKVLTVDDELFILRAEVRPGDQNQLLKASLLHEHENKEVSNLELKPAELPALSRRIRLKPGYNLIKLHAVNQDTPVGQEQAEQDWLALHINYKKAALPQIVLKAVVPVGGTELPIEPGKTVIVDTPRFRVVGEIEATEPLVNAEWGVGDEGRRSALDKFDSGQAKKWTISQGCTLLEPDRPQKFRFLAKTKSSDEAERFVVVEYHAQVPKVELTAPADGQVFREDKKERRIKVEAALKWPADRHPCRAEILIDDKAQGKSQPIDVKTVIFATEIELHPGTNEIQMRLSNGKREATSEKIRVSYRRPPRIVRLEQQAKKDQKVLLADLVAEIETPVGLPLTGAALNGVELPRSVWGEPRIADDRATYLLLVRNRGLRIGENEFVLTAGNADGESLPRPLAIVVRKEQLPRPVVQIIDPEQDRSWREPRYPATFRVTSSTPLQWIELRRGKEVLYSVPDLQKLPKNEADEYEVKPSVAVNLVRGPNALEIVAANDGGEESSRAIVVNYHREPVRVVFDHLEADGELIRLMDEGRPDGRRFAEKPARAGWAVLHGRVEWDGNSAEGVAKMKGLPIYVNGCRQSAVQLGRSSSAGQRSFKQEVLLTQESNNLIEIKLPAKAGIPESADSNRACRVDCLKPEPEAQRRLHLLIVDMVENDEDKVRDRVFRALRAQRNPRAHAGAARVENFIVPGFAAGHLYRVLTGRYISRSAVLAYLYEIHQELEISKASNDVVLIYYEGWELPDARDHFLGSGAHADRIRFRSDLAASLDENLGAQIVLLDGLREPPKQFSLAEGEDEIQRLRYGPNFSLLRFSWRSPLKARKDDARLLHEFEDALNQSNTLKKVTNRIDTQFNKAERLPWESKKYPRQLTYDRHLPAGLEELAFGAKN
jgi:hypothetical protein